MARIEVSCKCGRIKKTLAFNRTVSIEQQESEVNMTRDLLTRECQHCKQARTKGGTRPATPETAMAEAAKHNKAVAEKEKKKDKEKADGTEGNKGN